jgi:chemotaxis protein histidine kinase CheA
LFMCDAHGVVLDGYSEACNGFFVDAASGIAGRPLTSLLGMDARARDHFMAGYEQIFDDILPQEVCLANLPERIAVGQRTFSLAGSVVRTEDGRVSAVLFTLVDISALIEAEREVETLHGVVQVARYRARFEQFATQLHVRLRELTQQADGLHTANAQISARLLLHTAKGVFAQFGLSEIARQIHAIEDHERIEVADLNAVDSSMRALLDRHASIWDIQLERSGTHYSASESALQDGLRQKSVRELVGPLEESCMQQANRREKRVRFELQGGDVRWPRQLEGIFEVLPHMIRNSIDHGIESVDERVGKDEVATIRLSVSMQDDRLTLSLRDDGRGIALQRVEKRALELGAVSAAQLASMPEADRLQLVFVEGLSTAEQVSETSGRGVGMSAVKQTVDDLGGTLMLHSEEGRGTELRILFHTRAR